MYDMTICLTMIVKNEAHCIALCLESVKQHIDYWIICDTGSTDNTEDVVRNILKDIPGEYHKHEWVDFSYNRNLSLNLAKNKADYTLIIDADDYLISSNKIKPTELAYKIEIIHGNISYYRTQLIHNSLDIKYIGVLHEYLQLPSRIEPFILEDCKIYYVANGARSKDPEKFMKDALVLEKALIDEPSNARYIFYCAQSYRDASQYEKAINYYEKRSKMGGWIEEIYYSLLEIAKLKEILFKNNISLIESAYLKAYNTYPIRSESLAYLSAYCRKNNLFDKSYFYSKIGVLINKPNEGLFLEPDCYNWKLMDELAISAYYIGKRVEAAFLNKQLLINGYLPKQEINRVINNLKFCQS